MSTVRTTVDSLLRQASFLPEEEQRELFRRLAARRSIRTAEREQELAERDAALVQTTRVKLSKRDERRIRQLSAKTGSGRLLPAEWKEYGALAKKAEELSLIRVQALAELVRLRGRSAREIMNDIGWEIPNDDN